MNPNKYNILKGYRRIRLGEMLPENYLVRSFAVCDVKWLDGEEGGTRNRNRNMIRIVKKNS